MAISSKGGEDGGESQDGERQKLDRDKHGASPIDETDTDSSASDSSDGSDSDDEIAVGIPRSTATKDASVEAAMKSRSKLVGVKHSARGTRQAESNQAIKASDNGCTASSVKAPLNQAARGSPPGVVRSAYVHRSEDTFTCLTRIVMHCDRVVHQFRRAEPYVRPFGSRQLTRSEICPSW